MVIIINSKIFIYMGMERFFFVFFDLIFVKGIYLGIYLDEKDFFILKLFSFNGRFVVFLIGLR